MNYQNFLGSCKVLCKRKIILCSILSRSDGVTSFQRKLSSWFCLYSFFQYLRNTEQLLKMLMRHTFRSLFYSLAFQEISRASLLSRL